MKEVDARGLSCPEPLMLTAEALKAADGPVKVLVTEPHQKMNVEKYAKEHGKNPVSTEKDGFYEVVIE
ncbi:MAG: sulfurtransferase TusA family protein [Dorea sp.]